MTAMANTSDERMESARARERALADWLRERAPVLIGFSGGVDSSYLAAVAYEAVGPDAMLAVVGRSASLSAAQLAVAEEVARRVGFEPLLIDTRELEDPQYSANPTNRCFYCKQELWTRLRPIATERGMQLLDGTNADDLGDWRPGAAAGEAHGVESPLALLGFAKAEIRLLSAERGLPTAELPSAPCLASRLPYGTAVTRARLAQVEAAEAALRALGIGGDLRVRHHGAHARVELAPASLRACESARFRDAVMEAVRAAGFERVLLDLRGFRSGSLNVLGGVIAS